jgi:NAD(P)-dependent dehydrogenase (short-subunit alcohol dehydrogenase family)
MVSVGKSLREQNVLVTGASRGIGAAVVRQLAKEGATPIIQYGRDQAAAEHLLEEIGGDGVTLQADLSDPMGATRLWDQARSKVGRIHALVNNAGIRTEVNIDAGLEAWQSTWQKEFQVNLFAPADLCREAILHFSEHGGGKIVNLASRAGQRGYAAEAMAYGATKAALNNLTKSIARNFGDKGIFAVAIAPGWVFTDMAKDYIARFGKQAAVADIPIGEMALPEEIAEVIAFVLRSSQHSLNGATLDMNGGSYIR